MITDPTIVPVIETISTDTSPVTQAFARVVSPIGKSLFTGPALTFGGVSVARQQVTISHSVSNENNIKGETPVPTDRLLVRIDIDWPDPITDHQRKAFCYIVIGSPRVDDYGPVDAAKALKTLVGLLLTKKQVDESYALDSEVLYRLLAGEG
jgi:hypothetical protein